jgi:hypothetical protein
MEHLCYNGAVPKRMLNIRLDEEKIERLMKMAHQMQTERHDYRLGAATVVEQIVNEYLARTESPSREKAAATQAPPEAATSPKPRRRRQPQHQVAQ